VFFSSKFPTIYFNYFTKIDAYIISWDKTSHVFVAVEGLRAVQKTQHINDSSSTVTWGLDDAHYAPL